MAIQIAPVRSARKSQKQKNKLFCRKKRKITQRNNIIFLFALFANMDVGKGREQDAEALHPLRLNIFEYLHILESLAREKCKAMENNIQSNLIKIFQN